MVCFFSATSEKEGIKFLAEWRIRSALSNIVEELWRPSLDERLWCLEKEVSSVALITLLVWQSSSRCAREVIEGAVPFPSTSQPLGWGRGWRGKEQHFLKFPSHIAELCKCKHLWLHIWKYQMAFQGKHTQAEQGLPTSASIIFKRREFLRFCVSCQTGLLSVCLSHALFLEKIISILMESKV